jgi:hypothetical protein
MNISLEKFCCRKETWGYAKEKVKKERRKKESIGNNEYKDARHKKKKDSPYSCKYFKFHNRDMFSRSIVELG